MLELSWPKFVKFYKKKIEFTFFKFIVNSAIHSFHIIFLTAHTFEI